MFQPGGKSLIDERKWLLNLLVQCEKIFPANKPANHNLHIGEDGRMVVTLWAKEGFYSAILEDSDFNRDTESVAWEIVTNIKDEQARKGV
jgi:hypothetical protein